MKRNEKILIVEDEPITRMMLVRFLKSYFAEVIEADNGDAGISKFRESQPAVIVTDLSMPVKNGFKMIDEIKGINANAKVIVTTAYREEAKRLGDAEIVFKPINNTVLLEKIYKLLDN